MKIGIMSFAHHHAEAYTANLRAILGVELCGVADEDPVRGKRFAQAYNAPFYQTYEALLESKPDGVIICTENSKHLPLVEMAASSKINVLCEKPIATTVADAKNVVDVCARAGYC
jgi:predicted dehydrogenase